MPLGSRVFHSTVGPAGSAFFVIGLLGGLALVARVAMAMFGNPDALRGLLTPWAIVALFVSTVGVTVGVSTLLVNLPPSARYFRARRPAARL